MRSYLMLIYLVTAVASSAAPAEARPGAGHAIDSHAWVEAHNRRRAKHCAPPLHWSAKLAASAQRWAQVLRGRGCGLTHSGGQYGENLAGGTAGLLDAATVVGMWYDEIKGYSFRSGGFSMKTGHFTQVIWRSTREVGCARAQCGGLDVWVCQYDPPGNVQGQYQSEVQVSCH